MSARSIALPAVILLLAATGLVAAGRVGPQALPSHTLLGTVTDPGGRPLQSATVELSLPATAGSVHGLTMITPSNIDPKIVVPGNRPPQSMPFNDRTIPVPPATPQAPQSTVKPTMRIAQPTMCWDPMPAPAR